MKCKKVVPILRIFDVDKAIQFYVDWLGFKVDWEHRFEEGLPLYMQVSLKGIELHLSEHHGDGTPGTHIHIDCEEVKNFQKMLLNKKYNYGRPGLEKTFYGTWSVTVIDPFNNKITFNEELKDSEKEDI